MSLAAEIAGHAEKAGTHHCRIWHADVIWRPRCGNEFNVPRGSPMNCRSKSMWLMVLLALAFGQLSAQVLGEDALKKIVPSSFFFAGQSAPVQMRNSVGLKNAA